MITEGSTALRGVVEMGRVVNGDPTRFFAITDGGGDQRVNFLSVKKALVSLFLVHGLTRFLYRELLLVTHSEILVKDVTVLQI